MGDERRRVNQKLAFADRVLRDADNADAGVVGRAAATEAAIFHLVGAYRAFIAEIVGDEHVRRPVDTAAGDSAVATARAWPDYLPPALAELVSLEQSGAWPAELLQAWLWACRREEAQAPRADDDVIALASTGGGFDAPSLSDCHRWCDALQSLVERLRDDMQEW